MAWEYPKHKCGHSGERYQAYGPMDGRGRRLAAIESQPCPDCRADEAKKVAAGAGLPELVGSPKQIAWASDIRDRKMRNLKIDIEVLKAKPQTQERDAKLADMLGQQAKMALEASARWWIDNR